MGKSARMASTSNGTVSATGSISSPTAPETVAGYSAWVVMVGSAPGSRARRRAHIAVVSFGLEPVGELAAPLLGHPPGHEDVDEVGGDVAQDAGVVGDQQHAPVALGGEAVDAV